MKECSKCQQCYEDSHSVCPLDNNPLIFTVDVDVIVSGRYLLEKRLGRGGMGIVFKAKHKFLKSSHAIKVILPSLVEKDSNLLVRFKQEAVLAASIDHPNVIRVTDFGVENEKMPYLVMEFVDGTPLSLFLAHDNQFPVETAFEFFQPIALGVAEAHRKGIIHRDLKPQNIMVQKGLPLYKAVRVLDFGLAKIKSVESFGSLIQAQTMNVMGSPQYMSPEQWEDEEPDHRTDIYALGVILFQMLTGQLPFQSDSIPSVMYQHLTVPPPAFASLGVSLPPGIEAVVRKSLEKEPKARPNSIEEMLNEFEEALANSGITVPLSGFAPRRSKKTDASSIAKTSVLTDSQQEKLQTFFDASITQNLTSDNRLAQEFLKAQERAEKAEVKANQADKLVQEFAEAQKAAERAQQEAIEAKEKIEAELRRRLEAEMESKLAEQQARQKAESERLAKEAEARKQAEERANYLAQAALEAQKLAEAERKKAEQEAHQRELEESVRRRAEVAASQLSEQVNEAKRKFEEARKQAEYEAELRRVAELKRQKIESELQTLAEKEAERRAQAEAEARRLAQQQAEKFEQEAITAQKRVEEARRLAELEAKKREEAELAKKRAEEEAQRLAQEIIEVQKRMEEIKMHSSSAPDQTLNLLEFHSSGNVSAQTGGSSSSEKNPLDSSNETLPRVDVFGESPAQANTVANQTTPFVNVGEQPSSAQERSRITIETQSPPKSNPTFSNLFDSGSVKNRKVPIALMAAGGLFVLLTFLIGGFLIYAFVIQEPEQPVVTENPKKTETNSLPTNDTANTKPPLKTEPQTVLVEGASFQMGRSDVPQTDLVWGNQYPAHNVSVGSFQMDKTEVTNEKYAEFVQAAGHSAPSSWKNGKLPKGEEKYPVTNVSLADAKAYAEWISKRDNKSCRLPTEEEWEFAARNGSRQTSFPWGDDWREDAANLATGRSEEVGTSADETLVGGIKDMLGSVIEWTDSKYSLYESHPGKLVENKELYVVRGSSWGESEDRLSNAKWLITRRQAVPEQTKSPFLGFRLVCEP